MEKEAHLLGRKRGRDTTKLFRGDNYTEEIKKHLVKESAQPIILLEEKDEVKSKLNK